MKTAEEWLDLCPTKDEDIGNDVITIASPTSNWIRAIQLEAFKAGMTKAADIAHKDGTVYVFKHVNDTVQAVKKEILISRDNLTQLP